jgi:hypothetical protein
MLRGIDDFRYPLLADSYRFPQTLLVLILKAMLAHIGEKAERIIL